MARRCILQCTQWPWHCPWVTAGCGPTSEGVGDRWRWARASCSSLWGWYWAYCSFHSDRHPAATHHLSGWVWTCVYIKKCYRNTSLFCCVSKHMALWGQAWTCDYMCTHLGRGFTPCVLGSQKYTLSRSQAALFHVATIATQKWGMVCLRHFRKSKVSSLVCQTQVY